MNHERDFRGAFALSMILLATSGLLAADPVDPAAAVAQARQTLVDTAQTSSARSRAAVTLARNGPGIRVLMDLLCSDDDSVVRIASQVVPNISERNVTELLQDESFRGTIDRATAATTRRMLERVGTPEAGIGPVVLRKLRAFDKHLPEILAAYKQAKPDSEPKRELLRMLTESKSASPELISTLGEALASETTGSAVEVWMVRTLQDPEPILSFAKSNDVQTRGRAYAILMGVNKRLKTPSVDEIVELVLAEKEKKAYDRAMGAIPTGPVGATMLVQFAQRGTGAMRDRALDMLRNNHESEVDSFRRKLMDSKNLDDRLAVMEITQIAGKGDLAQQLASRVAGWTEADDPSLARAALQKLVQRDRQMMGPVSRMRIDAVNRAYRNPTFDPTALTLEDSRWKSVPRAAAPVPPPPPAETAAGEQSAPPGPPRFGLDALVVFGGAAVLLIALITTALRRASAVDVDVRSAT